MLSITHSHTHTIYTYAHTHITYRDYLGILLWSCFLLIYLRHTCFLRTEGLIFFFLNLYKHCQEHTYFALFKESHLYTTSIFWILLDRFYHLVHDPHIVCLVSGCVIHNHCWVLGLREAWLLGCGVSFSKDKAGTQPLISYFPLESWRFRLKIQVIFYQFTFMNTVYHS